MVKVSVVIPVYNVENYLEECLDSIVNQTMKDIEIICVNDGSQDGSERILTAYAELFSNIRVVNKENGGEKGKNEFDEIEQEESEHKKEVKGEKKNDG